MIMSNGIGSWHELEKSYLIDLIPVGTSVLSASDRENFSRKQDLLIQVEQIQLKCKNTSPYHEPIIGSMYLDLELPKVGSNNPV